MRNWQCCAAALAAAVIASDIAFSQEAPLALRQSVVAIVNKQVITRKKLDDLVAPALAELDKESNLSEVARRKRIGDMMQGALRALVNEELLLAEGKRLLSSNESFKKRFEEVVNARVEEEGRKAGGEAAFREALRKKGLTPAAFKDQVRDQILGNYVYSQFVLRDLSVSPREVLEYFQQNPNEFEEAARVKFREIFIQVTPDVRANGQSYNLRPPEDRDREAARKLADELQDQLKNGGDFAQLARKYSAVRANEGGLGDWTDKGALPKPVDDLLFALPVGAIGGPVETEAAASPAPLRGFMIVKVEDRKPARRRPFEEVQGEIERELLRRKRGSRYAALIRRLEAENYVEIMQ